MKSSDTEPQHYSITDRANSKWLFAALAAFVVVILICALHFLRDGARITSGQVMIIDSELSLSDLPATHSGFPLDADIGQPNGQLLAALEPMALMPQQALESWQITSLEWPPYSASGQHQQGQAIGYLRQLLARDNVYLQVNFYPWLRAQRHAENNPYIGYFPAWPEEVKAGFIASDPILYSPLSIVASARIARQLQQQDWAALSNSQALEAVFEQYRVGLIKTYKYPEFIQTLVRENPQQVEWSSDEQQLYRKLLAGRFNVVIADPSIIAYQRQALQRQTSSRQSSQRLNSAGQKQLDQDVFRVGSLNEQYSPLVVKKLARWPLVLAVRDSEENRQRIKQLNALLKRRQFQSNSQPDSHQNRQQNRQQNLQPHRANHFATLPNLQSLVQTENNAVKIAHSKAEEGCKTTC